ncbi:ATP phosphoribosyltransferase [Candidatus Vidania fulgoroideorum]
MFFLKTIKISIQKGRVFEIFKEKIKKIGFKIKKDDRRLNILNKKKTMEIVFSRSVDIKTVFKNKIADLFIMGLDIYLEKKLKYRYFVLKKYKFNLSIIKNPKKKNRKKIIYTKYPNILNSFKKFSKFKIIKVNGCLELYLKKNLCKYIFDIVDTGKTIKKNNLKKKCNLKSVFLIIVINNNINLNKIRSILNFFK